MKKYMHGYFSTEKLRKIESAINRFYSRTKLNKFIIFLIVCFYSLIQGIGYSLSLRYVGDFHKAISFDKIFILNDIQSLLDTWVFKDFGILNLAFPILIMIAASIVSYIATSLLSVILNLFKNLLFTGLLVSRISDKNQSEKIKELIKRIAVIRKVADPEVPVAVVAVFSYITAIVYPVYKELELLDEFTFENLLPILILAGLLLVVMTLFGTVPLMLSFSSVTIVNSSFYNKMSNKLYLMEKILDKWWVEIDPQEKGRREQEAEKASNRKRYSDSYISTMAKVYAREQSESSSSLPNHGPYGTATNCGMPRFGMDPSMDVRDM